MIKMMFKYELKKIFSKRVNQVLLAAVLVVTIIYSGMAIGSMRYVDEEGQNHTGIESGRLLAENINQWKGELTAEKISEVINDYKTISAKYPDEIPSTYGSASGFWTIACITTPHTERAIPTARASRTLGSRISHTTS